MDWFSRLEARERLVLFVGSALVLAGLLYSLLWLPLIQEQASLAQQIATYQDDRRAMLSAAQQLARWHTPKTATPTRTQSLLSLTDQSLTQAGLQNTNKRIEPRGDNEVRVEFTQVGFEALLQWLAALADGAGVTVQTLNLERHAEPGMVKAWLILIAAAS